MAGAGGWQQDLALGLTEMFFAFAKGRRGVVAWGISCDLVRARSKQTTSKESLFTLPSADINHPDIHQTRRRKVRMGGIRQPSQNIHDARRPGPTATRVSNWGGGGGGG